MSIFSTSSIHIGKMKLFFKVLRRNYCDMALMAKSLPTPPPLVSLKCSCRICHPLMPAVAKTVSGFSDDTSQDYKTDIYIGKKIVLTECVYF